MTTPAQSSPPSQKKKSRFFLGFMAVLGGVFFVLFLSLGIWQVERLQWKLDLIARVDARVHAEAVAAPGRDDWANVNQAQDEYRHVTLTGTYLNDKEVLVRALTERGSGFWVLTPLRTSDGALTFINRGLFRMASAIHYCALRRKLPVKQLSPGSCVCPSRMAFFFARMIRIEMSGIHAMSWPLRQRKIWEP